MIEAVMLVALGFASASLLALLVAPAFWGRALRLATLRIRSSLPVSEAEIRAEKDLMRADYAIRIHQLEKEIDEHKLKSHRQFIEVNRRDASVTKLSVEVDHLRSDLIENQSARLVLEQTVNDRLPKVEQRLDDARRLISARDQEIANLSHSSNHHAEVIDEARSIGAQQAAEIDRLKAALAASQARDRRRFTDVATEQEFALRGELERLRAVAREQGGRIDRLNAELAAVSGDLKGNARNQARPGGEKIHLNNFGVARAAGERCGDINERAGPGAAHHRRTNSRGERGRQCGQVRARGRLRRQTPRHLKGGHFQPRLQQREAEKLDDRNEKRQQNGQRERKFDGGIPMRTVKHGGYCTATPREDRDRGLKNFC